MIEAKDFRVGNLVYAPSGNVITVTATWIKEQQQCDVGNYDYLKPIPITEEWLLKFGAMIVLVKEIKYLVIDGLSFLYNGVDGYYIGLGKGFSVYVGYVHKLQNIYYEIRGKDLKFYKVL